MCRGETDVLSMPFPFTDRLFFLKRKMALVYLSSKNENKKQILTVGLGQERGR